MAALLNASPLSMKSDKDRTSEATLTEPTQDQESSPINQANGTKTKTVLINDEKDSYDPKPGKDGEVIVLGSVSWLQSHLLDRDTDDSNVLSQNHSICCTLM